MRPADFDFELPPELIAQHPTPQRDQSRLLVLHRSSGKIEHRRFLDLPQYLSSRDVLALNNSRVIPARLRGKNARSGGQFELLLLEQNATNDWWAMLRPGKRARVGTEIILLDLHRRPTSVLATVLEINEEGHRRLRFDVPENVTPSGQIPSTSDIQDLLPNLGEIPLPPYIHRTAANDQEQDRQRYQTVFAESSGSVAAPTAGLHFTDAVLDNIHERGVQTCFVTLHVGLGTFAPVKAQTLAAHRMHEEAYEVTEQTAVLITQAKHAGKRIIAAGTTTLRVLETIAMRSPNLQLGETRGRTNIFIHPPFDFKITDALLTNFHLPRSTLLMLVSAFAAPNAARGRDLIRVAYAEAIRECYRFFSYGDAMLIL
jgi:S-adenosylmethionine:tRNA ribosyltransferase-isomerase